MVSLAAALGAFTVGATFMGALTDAVYGYNKYSENVKYWDNYARKRGLKLKYPYRLGLVYNPASVWYSVAGISGSAYLRKYFQSGKIYE